MKIFVIGATGYIGSHAAQHLAAQGHDVTGFARHERGAAKLRELGITPAIGDVARLPELCAQALRADLTLFAPQLMADEEHSTVAALLDAYRDTGKALVFTSGTGVLGQRTAGAWSEDSFAEDDTFTPPKAIARRVETEQRVRASATQGLRGIVVRPPMIWGHGVMVAVDLIAESVRQTGAACYVGDGLNLYSNVHVDDLSALFHAVAVHGRAGALYHCVSGELSFRCMAEFIAQRLGCPTRSVTMDEAIALWGKFPALFVLGASSRSRCPRARQELGWQPAKVGLIDELLQGRWRSLSDTPALLQHSQGSPY